MKQIYDPVRCRWVAATPEELVRQALLQKMIRELGYPKGLMAVEKELGVRRRFDIVCYCPSLSGDEGISPLLIVECKAVVCSDAAREQAWGYNASLGAPFICIASKTEIHTLWRDAAQIVSVPFLPLYQELLATAKRGVHTATDEYDVSI